MQTSQEPDRAAHVWKTLVIGMGNDLRGDDGCGREVARRLRDMPDLPAQIVDVEGEPTELLDLWTGVHYAIVIDAVRSGNVPGNVLREELGRADRLVPTGVPSTHGFSLADAFELGATLGQLPHRLVLYGIEGGRFGTGEPMTPEVEAAIDAVVPRVADEIRHAMDHVPTDSRGSDRHA
jgi:hydrogenase maturation protease